MESGCIAKMNTIPDKIADIFTDTQQIEEIVKAKLRRNPVAPENQKDVKTQPDSAIDEDYDRLQSIHMRLLTIRDILQSELPKL